ncbi:MAG: hypothetical protein LUC39_08900, partial [Clostridiales bacterium]|nr:hypothetical protein [Clostridiales bacterium]
TDTAGCRAYVRNFIVGGVNMKEKYQYLLGNALVAIAIIIGAWIIGEAIQVGTASTGSQIASAIMDS